jgi:nitroreductase
MHPFPATPTPWGRSALSVRDPEGFRALEHAAELAVLAPSVHNTQPWRLELQPDRLLVRADRSRQVTAMDPTGRELVLSVGAALFNARVALAADGCAADVDRVPDGRHADLLAVVRPVDAEPDHALAALGPAVPRRRTNRRAFAPEEVPDQVLSALGAAAAAEGAVFVPVITEVHRRLLARLTQQADRIQNADPAYRAELRRWTSRRPEDGDGVPPSVVPRVDGRQHDDLPIRDFDTSGAGALPAETASGIDQTLALLATRTDDELAWLRCGEAMQRVLLELTTLGWSAGPITQAIEVPLTRIQLRSALSWDAHPQLLLRIGRAGSTPATPRRPQEQVVVAHRSSAASG